MLHCENSGQITFRKPYEKTSFGLCASVFCSIRLCTITSQLFSFCQRHPNIKNHHPHTGILHEPGGPPTPGPEQPSVFPPVSVQDHVRGAQDPVFTIMDYSDFQDPRSALFAAAADQLLEENPDKVRLVSRMFPLIGISDKSAVAAQAAEAAAEQGKYWEIRDLLYKQQADWSSLNVEDFQQWLAAQASSLDLDVEQFKTDMKRDDIVDSVQKAWEDDQKIGIAGDTARHPQRADLWRPARL